MKNEEIITNVLDIEDLDISALEQRLEMSQGGALIPNSWGVGYVST